MRSSRMPFGMISAMAGAMGGLPIYHHHQASQSRDFPVRRPRPGDKLRRQAANGTLTMSNPGGIVSEAFREKARQRNRKRQR